MHRNLVRTLAVLIGAFALSNAPVLRAESEDEREEKEAKAEQDAMSKDENMSEDVVVKGIVALNPLDENGNIPKVAGAVQGKLVKANVKTGEEKVFLLKLTDPKLQRQTIATVVGREIQLRGYLRNKEKYLIVTAVDLGTNVPPAPAEGL